MDDQDGTTSSFESILELIPVAEARLHFNRVYEKLPTRELQQDLKKGIMLTIQSSTAAATKPKQLILNDVLCMMPEVSFLAPRGTFQAKFNFNSLQIEGKIGTFIINSDDVLSIVILEQEKTGTLFLIQLKQHENLPPNGFLLVNVKGNNNGKLKTIIVDQSIVPDSIRVVIEKESIMRETVFSTLLSQCLVHSKPIRNLQVDKTGFRSFKSSAFVQCYYKHVNQGRLFLLSEQIVFVGSPNICVPFSDIESITCDQPNPKTFEINVHMKATTSTSFKNGKAKKNIVHEFSQIAVDEIPMIQKYLAHAKFGDDSSMKHSIEEEEQSDSGSLSSDDSEYTTSDEVSDEDIEEDVDEKNISSSSVIATVINVNNNSDNEVIAIDDDSNSSVTDSSDAESSDGDIGDDAAELVEEEKFIPSSEDILANGSKRLKHVF